MVSNKNRLLIVDDDAAILMSMTKILSVHYQVLAANSGEKALRIASKMPYPDLILLDVMMPNLNGYEVLRQLKQTPECQDIPVIFVSGMESKVNEKKGLELGAVDYITKPVNPAILLQRVKNHLQLKKAHDLLADQNRWLEAEIAKKMHDNLVIQNVSIRALANLAETRDPETGDHILRTQGYVYELALALKSNAKYKHILTDDYIDILTRSAPLHDIGKVGIPDHILLKKGKLTSSEWQVMKTHTVLGSQAIESAEQGEQHVLQFLTTAKEIAHWHHERFDGSGYPDGLLAETIPLSARIMAIADVFDALISERVYKKAFSYEQARQMITAERGKHFDPDLIDAFINCYDNFIKIAEQYTNEQ